MVAKRKKVARIAPEPAASPVFSPGPPPLPPGFPPNINPAELTKIDAPIIPVSMVTVQISGNDVQIVCGRGRAVADKYGSLVNGIGVSETSGILVMSPQTAKDLSFVLNASIIQFEAEFGVIDTVFLRQQRASGE